MLFFKSITATEKAGKSNPAATIIFTQKPQTKPRKESEVYT
jgi:hypothetical protein